MSKGRERRKEGGKKEREGGRKEGRKEGEKERRKEEGKGGREGERKESQVHECRNIAKKILKQFCFGCAAVKAITFNKFVSLGIFLRRREWRASLVSTSGFEAYQIKNNKIL